MATFPGFAAIAEVPRRGVSVGLGTIAGLSRAGLMILHGAHKRQAVRRLLESRDFEPAWPATILHRCRHPEIHLDAAAARGGVMTADTVDELGRLRDRIAASHAAACGMVHEAVPRDQAGQPLAHAVEPGRLCPPGAAPAGLGARHPARPAAPHPRRPRPRRSRALHARGADAAAERGGRDAPGHGAGHADHRRHTAESRLADAVRTGPPDPGESGRSRRWSGSIATSPEGWMRCGPILAAIDRALLS